MPSETESLILACQSSSRAFREKVSELRKMDDVVIQHARRAIDESRALLMRTAPLASGFQGEIRGHKDR